MSDTMTSVSGSGEVSRIEFALWQKVVVGVLSTVLAGGALAMAHNSIQTIRNSDKLTEIQRDVFEVVEDLKQIRDRTENRYTAAEAAEDRRIFLETMQNDRAAFFASISGDREAVAATTDRILGFLNELLRNQNQIEARLSAVERDIARALSREDR